MKWTGASQRKGTLRRLEADGKDVRAVTLYTHTFVLFEDGRADEQKQPFYTATAATPPATAANHRGAGVHRRMARCQPASPRVAQEASSPRMSDGNPVTVAEAERGRMP